MLKDALEEALMFVEASRVWVIADDYDNIAPDLDYLRKSGRVMAAYPGGILAAEDASQASALKQKIEERHLMVVYEALVNGYEMEAVIAVADVVGLNS